MLKMKHTITNLDHTILVTYEEEVTSEHVEKLSIEVLKIANAKTHAVNIIMDIQTAFVNSMRPAVRAGIILIRHLKKFNYCYIIANKNHQYEPMMSFFKTIGAARDRVLFYETVEQALADAEKHWANYLNKKVLKSANVEGQL
jgi:hypothetical protein